MNIFSTCVGCGFEVEEGKYHTDQETGVPHCLGCCKTYFQDCPEKTLIVQKKPTSIRKGNLNISAYISGQSMKYRFYFIIFGESDFESLSLEEAKEVRDFLDKKIKEIEQ